MKKKTGPSKGTHSSPSTEFKKGMKMPEGFNKGINNPMYGKCGSLNHQWKGGMPFCLDCGKRLSDRRAKRCSVCQFNYIREMNKAKGIGWKTKLNRQIRHCRKYFQWRKQIFTRNDYTCQICGVRNHKGLGRTVRMEVDHYPVSMLEILNRFNIKNMNDAIKCGFLWNTVNGRTVCIDCHNKTKWGRPTE